MTEYLALFFFGGGGGGGGGGETAKNKLAMIVTISYRTRLQLKWISSDLCHACQR